MTPNEARRRLDALDRQHGRFYDALIDAFDESLHGLVARALARTISSLQGRLTTDNNGNIAKVPQNLTAIANLDATIKTAMTAGGYERLVTQFVGQFPEQLPFLTDELEIISQTLKRGPLVPRELLASPDLETLRTQQSLTVEGLKQIGTDVAALAKRKAMLSLGGVDREELAETISKTYGRTVGEARTLGATSLAMFYRTASSRATEAFDEQDGNVRYVYSGPDDRLTRPFCRRMLKLVERGKSWTRAQIDRMDNGQLPDVWTSGGGFNCRHQFRIYLGEETIK